MSDLAFRPELRFAQELDASDPLRRFRDEFHLPLGPDGEPLIYFCGHSLGPQPKAVRRLMEQELDDWATLGVEAHFRGATPWYTYNEALREASAHLVGARTDEVVVMNGLTVNLHLMLATFYRPDRNRWKILLDEPTFPSDRYAILSQLRHHGLTPEEGLLTVRARAGEHLLREEDIEALLEREGRHIAVVLLAGVNYFTGQWLDLERLTKAGHRYGCIVAFDLAHAAGNVPLALHDWDVDFAVWCSYKYLNAGPGAIGNCFVHEQHGRNTDLPRLAGWWGNDPATRFRMDQERTFIPRAGADGWQVSNPPILAMAPLQASLALFEEAGMTALRAKSERLTGYLQYLLDRVPGQKIEIVTPREPRQRGCALSLLWHNGARELVEQLQRRGVMCDFRPPNVIRVAPAPLYNTYEEVWQFVSILEQASHSNLIQGGRELH